MIYTTFHTLPFAKPSGKPQSLRKAFRKAFWKASSRKTSLALACADGAAQSPHARAVTSPTRGVDGMNDMIYMKDMSDMKVAMNDMDNMKRATRVRDLHVYIF